MVRVRILRNVSAGVAGVAGISGALGIGASSVGCAPNVNGDDNVETQSSADTQATPAGSGVISLRSYEFYYQSTSGGDEFIRAGEKLAVKIQLADAVQYLSGRRELNDPPIDPAKVKATLKVVYKMGDGSVVSQAQFPVTFALEHGVNVGTSDEVVVPTGVQHLVVSFSLTDGTHSIDIAEGLAGHAMFAVFGAFGPNKLVLFDNDGSGGSRSRIVEGGTLTPGKDVTIAYTDWRADRVVDKVNLDTTIGDGHSYSRFGETFLQIHGKLNYEVSFAYSTDDGRTWNDGGLLNRDANPDVLNIPGGYGRYAFEKTFKLPNDATGLKVAFHLKAILVADPQYQYVDHWRNGYQLGASYTLKDVWDNNNGANYSLPVSN